MMNERQQANEVAGRSVHVSAPSSSSQQVPILQGHRYDLQLTVIPSIYM
jgi:hypothetical protein